MDPADLRGAPLLGLPAGVGLAPVPRGAPGQQEAGRSTHAGGGTDRHANGACGHTHAEGEAASHPAAAVLGNRYDEVPDPHGRLGVPGPCPGLVHEADRGLGPLAAQPAEGVRGGPPDGGPGALPAGRAGYGVEASLGQRQLADVHRV